MKLLARAADALWNPWLLGLFLVTGLVYSFGSGFFQIFELRLWWRRTAGTLFRRREHAGGGLSPLQALATALASTIGTGSIAGVAAASTALVPVMALLYLGSGGAVLLYRWERIPQALGAIFSCALSPAAAAGGGAGWTVAAALRHGVARGVFTNEAGLGASAMAHGAARTDPVCQGLWGIFEVFVSTLLVCTVTALAILVSGVWDPAVPGALTGAPLTAAAFSSVLGRAGEGVVALSLLLFAFSSILGWSYYGQQAVSFLMGREPEGAVLGLYRALFLGCTVLGAVWEGTAVWQLVDLCDALMALPNLAALLFLAPQALRLLRDWRFREEKRPLLRKAKKKKKPY